MEEIIYIRNGKEYPREVLVYKFGEDKLDAAIEKFGFTLKVKDKDQVVSKEKLSDNAQKVYERDGKEYPREVLEYKFQDKTDAAIAKFGFKEKIEPQEVDTDLGYKETEPEEQPEAVEEPVKKKENSVSKSDQTALESNTSDIQGSTSLATDPKQEIEDDEEPVGKGEDLWNRFKSGATTLGSNIAGMKNSVNKLIASAHFAFDPELAKKVNSYSPEVREILINQMYGGSGADQALGYASIKVQNELKDLAAKQKERTIEFEGNISDDIRDLNFGQAAYRILQGGVESAPSMIAAMLPSGLVMMGASAASGKMESLEDEGEDIGVKTALNSTINGVAEAFFEKYTQKMGQRVFKSFKGNAEVSIKTAKELVTRVAKDIGIEGGSEGLTELTQSLSDSFVQGREFNVVQLMKDVADAALIGGAMGGTVGGVGSLRPYIAAKSMQKKTKVAIEQKTLQAIALEDQASLPDVPEGLKKVLVERKDQLKSEVESLEKNELQRVKGMSDEQISNFFRAEKRDNELREELFEVESSDLSDDVKTPLMKDIKDELDRTRKVKEDLSKSEFDRLPKVAKREYLELAKQEVYAEGKTVGARADNLASKLTFQESEIEYTARKMFEEDFINASNKDQESESKKDSDETNVDTVTEPAPVETLTEPISTDEGRLKEDKIHALNNNGKPKAVLQDNKIAVNEGEVLDIEIYDAENGKVKDIKDRKRTDRLSLNVVDNKGDIPKNIGTLALWQKPDGTWYANVVDVIGEYRRLGIATAMYDFAEANGFEIVDSDTQTDRGKAFKKNRNEKTQEADGNDTNVATITEASPAETLEEPTRIDEGRITEEVTEEVATKKPIVREYKVAGKGQTYTVTKNDSGLEIKGKNGKKPSPKYVRKIQEQYAEDFDFTKGERASAIDSPDVDVIDHIANNSNNPVEIAEQLLASDLETLTNESISYEERAISERIGFISSKSFNNFGDRNNRNRSIGKSYLRSDGAAIDTFAEELNDDYGTNLTPEDIVDFIMKYPNGAAEVATKVKNEKILPLQEKFTELTGLPANEKFLNKAVQNAKLKEQYGSVLDAMNDDQLQELSEQLEESKKYIEYENTTSKANPSPKTRAKTKNSKGNGSKPSVRKNGDGKTSKSIEQGTEQKRSKSLITERIPVERRPINNTPRKLNEIQEDVAKELGATLINSKSNNSTLGTYSPKTAVVRIANAGDLDTTAHELGHFLDDRFNIIGEIPLQILSAAKNSLKWFSDRGGSNPPSGLKVSQQKAYLEREGLAEFLRAYMVNPDKTRTKAPELVEHIESVLPPKVLTAIQKYGGEIIDLYNAPNLDKSLVNVKDIEFKEKSNFVKFLEKYRTKVAEGEFGITWLDSLGSQLLSSWTESHKGFSHIATSLGWKDIDPSDDFRILSRLFSGVGGKIEMIYSNGMINAKNQFLKFEGGVFELDKTGKVKKGQEGTRMNIKGLVSDLDATSGVTLRKEISMTIALMLSQRVVELSKREDAPQVISGSGAGIESDLDIAIDYLSEINELKRTNREQYDRLNKAAAKYRQWADATLQYSVDKGRLTKEQYQKIKNENEYYVAMLRVSESSPLEEEVSKGGGSSGGSISSVKSFVKRARGSAKFIENPYVSLLHNTANIIRESDRNAVMQSFVNPIKEFNRNMGEGSPVNLSQIARPAKLGDSHTYTIYFKGKAEVWSFDKHIYKSLGTANGVGQNVLVDILAVLPSVMRTTVTKFPVFALRNMVRDTTARLMVSRNNSKFLDMINTASHEEVFAMYGGSQAGFYGSDKTAYNKQMVIATEQIVKSGGKVFNWGKFARKYDKLLEKGENKNRIAEFKSGWKYAKGKGMSDYDAGLYAAFQARDLMDFAEAGHTIRQLNRVIPFLNAGVQGLRRSGKAIKEDKWGFAGKTLAYSMIPTMAGQLMASMMGYQDEYEELPAYQRDLYWNYKLHPNMEGWITIPKPFELGVLATILDRSISRAKGYDTAYEGLGGTLKHSFMPFDETSPLGGYKPIAEIGANFNYFTGNAIVPVWEDGKMLELKDGKKYASRIGKLYSSAASMMDADVDPRNVDHLITGYGTYFGNFALALSDIGREDAKNRFDLTKTGFVRNAPISNSVNVQAVSDLVKELGMGKDPEVKKLRGYIEDYYTSDKTAERRKLSKKIREFAIDLRAELEIKQDYVEKNGKLKKKRRTITIE